MSGSLESLLVGRVLADRYAIEERIGSGGMSVVYRATDRRLGRQVALKVVSLPGGDGGDREQLRERLRREAASAAKIPTHPNVVQVYDYGTDPELDLDFIAMELFHGEDLKTLLRSSPPSLDRALSILVEAARGLAAGHRAGIVHRDVKPANIFLTHDHGGEVVKILDFGIAKALEVTADDELTRTGQMPHSPAYASPEQLRGSGSLGAPSDVYQLAVVAYELLAGERPFGDEERARMRAGEEVPVPERAGWRAVSAPLRAVVERAMRPRPEERYPDAGAFVEALTDARDATEPQDEDATMVIPASAGTVTERLAPRPAAAAPAGKPAPPAHEPAPSRRGGSPALPISARTAAMAGGGLLALLLLVVVVLGRGSDADVAEPVAAAEVLDTDALGEEFRPIFRRARENLLQDASPVEGQTAAEAVHQVIADVNHAWVMGDLQRHVSHYADRVDFYNARNGRRSVVERDRGAALQRYPERQIVIQGVATEFPEPGSARSLVDKTWTFASDSEAWEGEVRQELRLELTDGRWLITAERDLEVFRSERRRR